MPLSRDDVICGFRMILGRDPGSDAGIAAHMKLRDTTELASVLLQSAEFRQSERFKGFLHVRPPADGKIAAFGHAVRSGQRALVIGNCQAATIASLMQAMTGDMVASSIETTPDVLRRIDDDEFDLETLLSDADLVFIQLVGAVMERIRTHHPQHAHKLRLVPPLNYPAFHPDCVYIRRKEGGHLQGPMGDYQSSIAFWAWSQGWSVEEALTLFAPAVYEQLGFHQFEQTSRKVLNELGQQSNLPMQPLLDRWGRSGVWMHTINHPRIGALADVTAEVLRREGIEPMVELAHTVRDTLADFPVWPVYPPLAARWGVQGSYLFKIDRGLTPPSQPCMALTLEQMLAASFAAFETAGRSNLVCDRTEGRAYAALKSLRPAGAIQIVGRRIAQAVTRLSSAPAKAASPYQGLPDHHFWRRMMEQTAASEVDPVRRAGWQIARSDKVATAGSCFAQHISKALSGRGFRFLVTEAGDELDAQERTERQYGVFSARYGNIYTARQLVQLFDRAYGRFSPADVSWQRPDGRYVDPFRPQVEPQGFASEAEVVAAREHHLAAVRAMFEQLDVFLFTLGLTESWQRKSDGAVFPLAPGVVAGSYDSECYGFINFQVAEVLGDIQEAVRRIRSVNRRARLVFTVSPVPLIATYEDRHVLVSTVESKSILRAAIGQAAAADPGIEYFPSYEIITGQHARGAYFGPDLRSVTEEGVAHVMRVFLKHFTDAQADPAVPAAVPDDAFSEELLSEQRGLADIVCDEEAIERHRSR
jgi:hypothetical protein